MTACSHKNPQDFCYKQRSALFYFQEMSLYDKKEVPLKCVPPPKKKIWDAS